MVNKDLKFTVISTIISFISLALLISSMFLNDKSKQIIIIIIALGILALQKIIEIICVKKTRKISIPVLILLIFSIIYFVINKL